MDFIHYKPEFDYYSSDKSEDERYEDLAMDYGYVLQLIDMDVYLLVPDVRMEEPTEEPVMVETSMEEFVTNLGAISIANDGKKKNKYGPEQIRVFIELTGKGAECAQSCQKVYDPKKQWLHSTEGI